MLNKIVGIFVNRTEHRARMVWRVLVQTILMGILLLPSGVILTGYYLNEHPSVSPAMINREMLVDFMSNVPSALLLSTIITAVATVVSVLIAIYLMDRRKFSDYGLRITRRWWGDFGFGLALGGVLMAIVFFVELSAGWITIEDTFHTASGDNFVQGIILIGLNFVLIGFYEELLSRGYHLTNFAQGFRGLLGSHGSIIGALFLSSAIFGIMHLGNPDATIVSTVNIVIVGILLLGLGFVLTGSLAIPIGTHISWNFFQGAVFGFPVSGLGGVSARFILLEQTGNPLITGGNFGPEAGLIGVAAVILGTALICWWVRLRCGQISIRRGIAFYQDPDVAGATDSITTDTDA